MITNNFSETLGIDEAYGSAGTYEQDGFGFTAYVRIPGDGNLGVYGCGANEAGAIAALEAKLFALGKVLSANFEEARAPLKLKQLEEDKAERAQLRSLLDKLAGKDEKKTEEGSN